MYALTNLRKYAPKGAEITVITKAHPTVWIVEYNGDRFPCNPELLSNTTPVTTLEVITKPEDSLI